MGRECEVTVKHRMTQSLAPVSELCAVPDKADMNKTAGDDDSPIPFIRFLLIVIMPIILLHVGIVGIDDNNEN